MCLDLRRRRMVREPTKDVTLSAVTVRERQGPGGTVHTPIFNRISPLLMTLAIQVRDLRVGCIDVYRCTCTEKASVSERDPVTLWVGTGVRSRRRGDTQPHSHGPSISYIPVHIPDIDGYPSVNRPVHGDRRLPPLSTT